MKFIKTPVKGMCDMLPADMRLREHVLGMIKESYGAHGFMEIETLVIEAHIENLSDQQAGRRQREAHLQGHEARRGASARD